MKIRAVACSIVSSNYLAQARVLMESLKATNPNIDRVLLVLDHDWDDGGILVSNARVLGLDFLGQEPLISRMAMIYDVVEFATAVKPFLLRELIKEGYDVAFYFDPDIIVCGVLAELARKALEEEILLTPHALASYPRDGLSPSERDIMRVGIFNLGFIAVSSGADQFLDWWAERLETECLVNPDAGLFTDQRWIDWVPSLFSVAIERNPGANVAYWNLHERELIFVAAVRRQIANQAGQLALELGKKVRVNGEPLIFFHFSGFSPLLPKNISKHFFGHLRVSLSDSRAISEIFALYGQALLSNGFEMESRRTPPSKWILDGVDHGSTIRNFLRENWTPNQSSQPFPDPEQDPNNFMSFVLRNSEGAKKEMNKLERSLYEKLLTSFRQDGFFHMLRKVRVGLKSRVMAFYIKRRKNYPPPESSDNQLPARRLGLLRYSEHDFSIGVVAGRIQSVLAKIGLSYDEFARPIGGGEWKVEQHTYQNEVSTPALMIVANADQTPSILAEMSEEIKAGRKRIGYWFWELENVPVASFAAAEDEVDEIWVASEFIAETLRPVLSKPVVYAPLPLFDPERHGFRIFEPREKEESEFTFLGVADLASVPARKNLVGLVKAYKKAFPFASDCSLTLKVSFSRRSKQAILGMKELQVEIGNRPDIQVIDRKLSSAQMDQLFRSSHVYVSLHRAEGLALNVADSVAFGVPVIATAYGGCVDFLAEDSAYLVSFDLQPIGEGNAPYSPFGVWAEPNLDEAAAYMREARSDYGRALGKAIVGKERIIENFGLDEVSKVWLELMQ